MSYVIDGKKYVAMYGPTTGDKIRLADTNLLIEVEKDFTVYGDEIWRRKNFARRNGTIGQYDKRRRRP